MQLLIYFLGFIGLCFSAIIFLLPIGTARQRSADQRARDDDEQAKYLSEWKKQSVQR